MTSSFDPARESARKSDGKFGTQVRSEPEPMTASQPAPSSGEPFAYRGSDIIETVHRINPDLALRLLQENVGVQELDRQLATEREVRTYDRIANNKMRSNKNATEQDIEDSYLEFVGTAALRRKELQNLAGELQIDGDEYYKYAVDSEGLAVAGVRYYENCEYCEGEELRESKFFPSHNTPEGHRPHCTCDSCF